MFTCDGNFDWLRGFVEVSTKRRKFLKLGYVRPLFVFCKGFVVILWWGGCLLEGLSLWFVILSKGYQWYVCRSGFWGGLEKWVQRLNLDIDYISGGSAVERQILCFKLASFYSRPRSLLLRLGDFWWSVGLFSETEENFRSRGNLFMIVSTLFNNNMIFKFGGAFMVEVHLLRSRWIF